MKRNVCILFCLCLTMPLWAQVRVIAHRGHWTAEGSAPNSIAALAKADSIGTYGSEFDVWMNREGNLFVGHNRLYKGVDMYRSSSQKIGRTHLKNGEPIPTLDEYLEYGIQRTRQRLILEMKPLPSSEKEDKAVHRIVQALNHHQALERTDIISFSLHACLLFHQLLPQIPVYYLRGDLPPQEVKALGLAGIDYPMKILKKHPEWIQEAHALGLKVNTWTINKEKDMREMIRLGVDFITTNDPVSCLQQQRQ